jgi:hypothetical protein
MNASAAEAESAQKGLSAKKEETHNGRAKESPRQEAVPLVDLVQRMSWAGERPSMEGLTGGLASMPLAGRQTALRSLQRTRGNSFVQRLAIQAKLTVGAAGDRYEQEANQIADQVMRMTESPEHIQRQEDEEEDEIQAKPLAASITPLVQRTATAMPLSRLQDEDEEEIQTKRISAAESFEAGTDFESRLSSTRGGGSPLPDSVRGQMEESFGADFSDVRVHTGGEAAQLNRAVSAQAFTHGQDIYLGEGKSNLESNEGQKLLAHELTHVVQQTGLKVVRQAEAASQAGRAAVQLSRTDPTSLQRVLITSADIMAGLNRIPLLQQYLGGTRSLLDENIETEHTTTPIDDPAYIKAQQQEAHLRAGQLRQGLTLGTYITSVFANYDAHFATGRSARTANATRLAAALSSIGAAIANMLHAPYAQPEITTELLDFLRPGLIAELQRDAGGEEAIKRTLAFTKTLVGGDPIGLYLQKKMGLQSAARKVVEMARADGHPPEWLFDRLSEQYQIKMGSFTSAEVDEGERPELQFAEGHFAIPENYGEISRRYFGEVVRTNPAGTPEWRAGAGDGLELQPEAATALQNLRAEVARLAAVPHGAGPAMGHGAGADRGLTPAQEKYLTDLAAREDPVAQAEAWRKLRHFFRPELNNPGLGHDAREEKEREANVIITACLTHFDTAYWVMAFKPQNIFKDAANPPTTYKHYYDVNLEQVSLGRAIPGSGKQIERIKPSENRGPDYGIHRYEKDLRATGFAELTPKELPRYGSVQVVPSLNSLAVMDVYGKYHFIVNKATFNGRAVFAVEHGIERKDPLLLLADMANSLEKQPALRSLANGFMATTGIEFHIVGALNHDRTDIAVVLLAKGVRRGFFGRLKGLTLIGAERVAVVKKVIMDNPTLSADARAPLETAQWEAALDEEKRAASILIRAAKSWGIRVLEC